MSVIPENDARQALFEQEGQINTADYISNDDTTETTEQSATVRSNKTETTREIRSAFLPINVETLPSKGYFYDPNIDIAIRALTTTEIKLYSSMDEDDIFDVNRALADVLNSTVSIVLQGRRLSYKYLSEFDKIYLIFLIQERTKKFEQRETNIVTQSRCPYCDTLNEKTLERGTLGYYQVDSNLMQYYSPEERCFVFNHSSFDTPLKIYIPCIGTTEYITEYMRQRELEKQQGDGGYYNPVELTLVMYTVNDYQRFDPEGHFLQRCLDSLRKDYSVDKYNLALEVVNRLKIGIKPNINYICEGCSKEVSAPVRFRQWRNLFSSNDIVREFFPNLSDADTE